MDGKAKELQEVGLGDGNPGRQIIDDLYDTGQSKVLHL